MKVYLVQYHSDKGWKTWESEAVYETEESAKKRERALRKMYPETEFQVLVEEVEK